MQRSKPRPREREWFAHDHTGRLGWRRAWSPGARGSCFEGESRCSPKADVAPLSASAELVKARLSEPAARGRERGLRRCAR